MTFQMPSIVASARLPTLINALFQPAPSTDSPPTTVTQPPYPPLATVIPPLVLGTATFNHQYVASPTQMPYRDIVARALHLGVRAFDTSPYYGPSELLLGDALDPTCLTHPPDRASYLLITKAGRLSAAHFDYSPAWLRYSVARSLHRLRTPYLDLVFCHDVEFVDPAAVVAAVRTLRRLRDAHGVLRYVGISGYPLATLAALAQRVLAETGEPLDAVQTYAHLTIQNAQLADVEYLAQLRAARVGVVCNSSMLGMGLLTARGIDASPMAVWHPAPPPLRTACHELAGIAAEALAEGALAHDGDDGESPLEQVALAWSLGKWATAGAEFGARGKVGVSIMGVTSVEQLEQTVQLHQTIIDSNSSSSSSSNSTAATMAESASTPDNLTVLVETRMRKHLGAWYNYEWESPGVDFVHEPGAGVIPSDDQVSQIYSHIVHDTSGMD